MFARALQLRRLLQSPAVHYTKRGRVFFHVSSLQVKAIYLQASTNFETYSAINYLLPFFMQLLISFLTYYANYII